MFAVQVDDDTIDLRLAPARPDAPAPWTPVDEGRTWRLGRDAEEAVESSATHRSPGLVCLGRTMEGTDVLVDLESVGGVVAVTGHETTATEVVSALAVQLATAPWTDEQRVYGHHLSEVLADLAGDRLVLVDDYAPLLERLDQQRPAARRPGGAHRPARPPSRRGPAVRRPRLAARRGAGRPVRGAHRLGGARLRRDHHRRRGRHPLAARGRQSGTLTVPLLDVQVEAVRLTARSTELVAGAVREGARGGPAAVDGRVRLPAATRPGDDWPLEHRGGPRRRARPGGGADAR